jgi:single-strand DNA-binding protein
MLQTQSWEKDGVKQYRTEIVADRIQFGPKADGGGGGNYQSNNSAPTPANGAQESAPVMPEYPSEEINPEDIPF